MHFHLNKISHLNPKSPVQEDRSQNEGIVKVPLKALLAKIDFRISIIYEKSQHPPIQRDRSKSEGDWWDTEIAHSGGSFEEQGR